MEINYGGLRPSALADTLSSSSNAQKTQENQREIHSSSSPMPGDTLRLSFGAREAASSLSSVRLDFGPNTYTPSSTAGTDAEDEASEKAAAAADAAPAEEGASSAGAGAGGAAEAGGAAGAGGAEGAAGPTEAEKAAERLKELQEQVKELQKQKQEIMKEPESDTRDAKLAAIDSQIAVLQALILEMIKQSGGGGGGTPGLEAKGGSGLSPKANCAWEKTSA